MTSKRRKGISVVICTHNGSNTIRKVLRNLSRQKLADIEWEILLVDNASTDNVSKIAAEEWENYRNDIELRILNEHQLGKDKALELGFKESKYSYLIICDDDNLLSDTYLRLSYQIMEKDPQIGVLGSRAKPIFECKPPTWINKFYSHYAIGRQNSSTGEIKGYGFVWGAGAVYNMEAYNHLKKIGYQRILTYENNPRNCRSEDVELCLAIRLAGFKLWYCDKLTLQHYISSNKLRWSYLMKISTQAARALPVLRAYWYIINEGKAIKYGYMKLIMHYSICSFIIHLNPLNTIRVFKYFMGNEYEGDHKSQRVIFFWTEYFESFRIRRTLFDAIKQANHIRSRTFNA